MKRGGSLLERNVARLFRLGGFGPELNKKIHGYEIDVFIQYKSVKLGVECKQYERSSLATRNLIHEWDSKNKELNLDRILLVIVGCDITGKDRDLAKRYGITIWDTEKFDGLFEETIKRRDKMKNKLLLEAGLGTTDEIKEEIRKVENRYGCSEWLAVKFLRGEVSEKELDMLRGLPPRIELSGTDLKKFAKNAVYCGIPFRKIVEVMDKYNLKDKKMAKILIAGSGGYGGKRYSRKKTAKIKLLVYELGLPFSTAERYSKRRLTTLREAVETLKSDGTITFNQALRICKRTRKSKQRKGTKESKKQKSFFKKLLG